MKYSDRILNTPSSFIRDILKVTDAPDVISFAGGLPNPVSFPIGDLQESIEGPSKKNEASCSSIHDGRLFALAGNDRRQISPEIQSGRQS